MQHSSKVAVIPARGGSVRVPHKNIRPLGDLPSIVHVINACKRAGVFDRIVVSTDDTAIGNIAAQAGAEVPFTRPPALADDQTGILPVVQHAVDELELPDRSQVACVYATAVTIDSEDLAHSHERLLQADDSFFVISVTGFDAPIQRALTMASSGVVSFVDPHMAHVRSQDLDERWHDAGQFIWGYAETWRQASSVWDAAIGFPVPHWRAVDIDTQDDWQRAEFVLAMINKYRSDR